MVGQEGVAREGQRKQNENGMRETKRGKCFKEEKVLNHVKYFRMN